MLLDFYLLSALLFHTQLQPALAESWRRRSFAPCRDLCAALVARSRRLHEHCLLAQVLRGLPFARDLWHCVAGEVLVLGCEDMPLVQTAPTTLCCLLAPERYAAGAGSRSSYAPIEQVHFGSRDLRFGGAYYRPEYAGYNDTDDVLRLVGYLQAIEPAGWTELMLRPITQLATTEERAEELAFVRDWWRPLVDVYRAALERQCVVVCEQR